MESVSETKEYRTNPTVDTHCIFFTKPYVSSSQDSAYLSTATHE